MKFNTVIGVLGFIALLSCSPEKGAEQDLIPENTNGHWLVPFEDILYWGDPADEIQSIDEPEFTTILASDWDPEDRMLVQYCNGKIKAYPVTILEEHEIVNDCMDDYFYAISYCPITGSGMSWNRSIHNEVTEFGVSGMLYQENLVPYDRNTGSYWSQMRMLCIHGDNIESVPDVGLMFETDFKLLSNYFPEAAILADSEPLPLPQPHPLGFYKDATDDIEPGGSSSDLLNPGEYYYGAISNNRALVFSMDMFDNQIKIYSPSFYGKQLLVVGQKEKNFIVAFELSNSPGKNISPVIDQFPVIMQDEIGNKYDVFGVVVTGPDKGAQLNPAQGYRAKGFAWTFIFNPVKLYQE